MGGDFAKMRRECVPDIVQPPRESAIGQVSRSFTTVVEVRTTHHRRERVSAAAGRYMHSAISSFTLLNSERVRIQVAQLVRPDIFHPSLLNRLASEVGLPSVQTSSSGRSRGRAQLECRFESRDGRSKRAARYTSNPYALWNALRRSSDRKGGVFRVLKESLCTPSARTSPERWSIRRQTSSP